MDILPQSKVSPWDRHTRVRHFTLNLGIFRRQFIQSYFLILLNIKALIIMQITCCMDGGGTSPQGIVPSRSTARYCLHIILKQILYY